MRPIIFAAVAAFVMTGSVQAQTAAASAAGTSAQPAWLAAAIHDPQREADAANDDRRKLAQVIAFAQVKPGDKVLELIPGGGYFTRVFSDVVGADGHVYAMFPNEYAKESKGDLEAMRKLAKQPHYANISVLAQPAAKLSAPSSADVVFTSQNYHDYPDKFMGKIDPVTLDKQVFDALKPGGVFVVIDHAAQAGSGMHDTETLHRIDPKIVKRQVLAAGFEFDGQNDALHNNADSHELKVFDKSIRGHTDQFMLRFRKPAR